MSVLSMFISFIAVIVALWTHKRSTLTSLQPMLIFSMNSDFRWSLRNVGNGPAINVLVADVDKNSPRTRNKRDTKSVTECYPIAAGDSTELIWLESGWELIAVYCDVFGHTYTSICAENKNAIRRGNRFPGLKRDGDECFQRLLAEGRELSDLREEHLEGKTPFELDIMRNEPYARKGYIFHKRLDIKKYFENCDWYVPRTDDRGTIHRQMSPKERYEAHLILNYQRKNNLLNKAGKVSSTQDKR